MYSIIAACAQQDQKIYEIFRDFPDTESGFNNYFVNLICIAMVCIRINDREKLQQYQELIDGCLSKADTNLYKAKQAGGDTFIIS